MTKERSTKIVNIMTPGAGVLVLGHGHISHIVKRHYFFKNLLLYSRSWVRQTKHKTWSFLSITQCRVSDTQVTIKVYGPCYILYLDYSVMQHSAMDQIIYDIFLNFIKYKKIMCVRYKAENNLVMNLCYIRKIYIVDRGVLHVAQCNTCMPSSEGLWLPYTYVVGLHKKNKVM